MKRLRYPAGWWRHGLLLLLLLGALLSAVAARALARQQPSGPEAAAVLPHLANEKRRYYISDANFSGDVADTACAAGYHTASLWEIFDPSELTYANIPAAEQQADQGGGPVAGWWGWVRTGGESSVINLAGRANCNSWSSNVAGEYGTIAMLNDDWTAAGVAISPWRAQTWSCGGNAPVWCASDPVYGSFVPLFRKQ